MPLIDYFGPLTSSSAILIAFSVIATFIWPQSETYCYASIKTLSRSPSEANCFSVSSVGTFSNVFNLDLKAAQQYQRPGHVLPGLWDGHGHLLPYGESLHSVNLFGSQSLNDALNRIHQFGQENPELGSRDEWIRGIGWDQAAFGGKMPTAADLSSDHLLDGKYVMLDRVDVHCVWVSQAVLDLLPDPLPSLPGGEVVTDPGMGVFCDNAMDFVRQYWPPPSTSRKTEFLRDAAKELNKLGLVGMHDAGIIPEDMKLQENLANEKYWSLRVYGMFECPVRNTFCPKLARKISQRNGFFTVRSVKLFADGALGSWGSALIDPYTDRPATRGSLLVNSTTLTYLAESWSKAGYQVNIHAIGDLANRLALDALNSSLVSLCPPSEPLATCQSSYRFRVEHSQIIHPDDQARMHALEIIPSIQPTHATSDMAYAEDRLGRERTKIEAYRMRSLLPLHPILGSDFPVEPPNPWQGIYAAVTRMSPHTGKGKDGEEGGWHTEQALTVMDALRGFTINAARGAFLEHKAGVIEKGAYADWVVLDEDIEEMDVEKLRSLRVRETWVAGRQAYKRGA